MAKASIIIITHNRPRLLSRAVESVRAAGTDVEIVVVDNESSDETRESCISLPGIKYVRIERKQPLGSARNIGLVASSGECVSFLDDDDTRLANSFELQMGMLEREPQAGLIYGQAIFGDQDGKPLHGSYPAECPQGDIFWELLARNFIPCGSVIFRRSCLYRVGLFDDDIPRIADWDLWVRIAEIYPIIAVETPVCVWRRSTPRSGQATSQAAMVVAVAVRQFRRWMKLPRAAGASRKTKRALWLSFSENMAEHLIWEATRALHCGETRQALSNLLTVPRLHPLTILRIAKHRVLRTPRTGLRETLHWRSIRS